MIDWKGTATLGSRGWTTLYIGEERITGRTMAVKVMKASPEYVAGRLATEQEVRALIQREISILGCLKHVSLTITNSDRSIRDTLPCNRQRAFAIVEWTVFNRYGLHSLEKHCPIY